MASVYMSLSPTGDTDARYALSSPMVTLNGRNLAAFLSVDATPGPDYGKFTLLQFPAASQFESPAQIQNDIESDNRIAGALTLQRNGNSKVVLGNLLSIPVNGKVLYVEPVYTQSQGRQLVPDPAARDRGVRRRRTGLQAHPGRRAPPGDRERPPQQLTPRHPRN